ncbi:uncharacterized protein LOC131956543 [Physella acuta]|uniref:uncharacterized protein LOC131956543 n=1 Tax=Physella acuta TaxID=109671 RepID=UPI0027DB9911|nr:uncharacterized protein LOC131956543 [Physella acuta]
MSFWAVIALLGFCLSAISAFPSKERQPSPGDVEQDKQIPVKIRRQAPSRHSTLCGTIEETEQPPHVDSNGIRYQVIQTSDVRQSIKTYRCISTQDCGPGIKTQDYHCSCRQLHGQVTLLVKDSSDRTITMPYQYKRGCSAEVTNIS